MIDRKEKAKFRLKELVVAPVLVCLFLAGILTPAASEEATYPEAIQSLSVPQTAAELSELLNGKWRQISWRSRRNPGEYRPYSEQYMVYKHYYSGQFVFYNYDVAGKLYTAYGGAYEVLSENRIRETTEFFGPYDTTSAGPESGQLVLHTGVTMVGAVAEFQVVVADGKLYLSGDQRQNTASVKHPDRYKDRYYDHGHIKLHD